MTIRDNKDYIRVLLYSYYATITGWGVLLRDRHWPEEVPPGTRVLRFGCVRLSAVSALDCSFSCTVDSFDSKLHPSPQLEVGLGFRV